MACTPTTGGYTGGRRRTNYLLVQSARQQVRTLSYDVPGETEREKNTAVPDGKAPELQEEIATDETIFLLVGSMILSI